MAAATSTARKTRSCASATAALDQLELQRWLHAMNRDRHSYFGGDAWHECTLDAY